MSQLTFTPRGRLMLLLGDQLIRDAGIAVFELVKNAYDADATKCVTSLYGVHLDSSAARIVIEDDGTGMDLATVREVWLSPGARHRLTQREALLRQTDNPARSKRGRLPLGEKGVGRFAVHKLGNRIEMVSRAAKANEVVVTVDWTQFDNDCPLETVPVTVVEREPHLFTDPRTGTRIEISDLREMPWTQRRVCELRRAIMSICSPHDGPSGFLATLELDPDPGDWLKSLLSAEDGKGMALFRFNGRIEHGILTYDYEFKPWAAMKAVQPRVVSGKSMPVYLPKEIGIENLDATQHDIGPINIDFRMFDRERVVLQFVPGNSRLLEDFLDQDGGVRVYRDGVRVYDFGEAGNDWLELGGRRFTSSERRIRNNQIVGVVRLQLAQSQGLIEKTNREGFVENSAYLAFREAVKFTVAQAEAERRIDKDRIRHAYSREEQKTPVLGEVTALREEIGKLQLDSRTERPLVQHLAAIECQFEEVLDRLLTAASAGLNLAVVMHEVEKGINSLDAAIRRGEPTSVLSERSQHLREIVDGLTWLTLRSGITEVSADALIRHCLFASNFRFTSHQIALTNGLEFGDPGFAVQGTRRLLMAALMNLIDNAIYWVDTKLVLDRRIYVGTTIELTGNPALVVADNGPGLGDPPEYLTMPFFTRKPDGLGLGLHIADEIMKLHGGRVAFPDSGDLTLANEFAGAVVVMQFGNQKS